MGATGADWSGPDGTDRVVESLRTRTRRTASDGLDVESWESTDQMVVRVEGPRRISSASGPASHGCHHGARSSTHNRRYVTRRAAPAPVPGGEVPRSCSRHWPAVSARSRRSTISSAGGSESNSQRSTFPDSVSPARAITVQRVWRTSRTSRRVRRPQTPFHHRRTTSCTPATVHTFDQVAASDGERVSHARSEGLLAAVLRAPAVGLAAVRAVPIHPKITSATAGELRRDLVQAGPPHDGLPAAGHRPAVTRPAAQQHLHPYDRR